MTTTITGADGVSKVQTGAIEHGDLPSGSVLQVVSASTTAAQSTTSTSCIDTGLSVAITPSSTSSKVKIEFVFTSIHIASGVAAGCSFRIMRDSTSLYTAGAQHAFYAGHGDEGLGGITYRPYMDMALDSPSTTSAITYKVQVATHNSGAITINYSSNFKATIMATEIAG
jgi:hypothetical protein